MTAVKYKYLTDNLEKYTSLSLDDTQELIDGLISLLNREHTMLNTNLYKNILVELNLQLNYYKDHYHIIEKEETETRIVKYLEWKQM